MEIISDRFTTLKFLALVIITFSFSCDSNKKPKKGIHSKIRDSIIEQVDGNFKAYYTSNPIKIDGKSEDTIWSRINWYSMNYVWLGDKVDSTDYTGKFKLAWDNQYLYVLVHVVDDYLHPTLKNGLENYWKGDYVEVFIDEDKSGGLHKFNHQAFAYHVSTEGHALDKGITEETIFLDEHVEVKRTKSNDTYLWEMAILLFDKDFDENSTHNKPIKLTNEKKIGFSIAYGDNDGNNIRENFIGSKKTHGNNNDEGYINADVFGRILFLNK